MLKGNIIWKNQAKIYVTGDCMVRSKYFSKGFEFYTFGLTSKNYFYHTKISDYPDIKQLPLPLNIKNFASYEKLKFSPQRSRDINGLFISSCTSFFKNLQSNIKNLNDKRIECYDYSGVINLSSATQTNVPFPFVSRGNSVYVNLYGGQYGPKERYVSEELNNIHHSNIRQSDVRRGTSYTFYCKTGIKHLYVYFPNMNLSFYSTLWTVFNKLNMIQQRKFSTVKEKTETLEETSVEKIVKMGNPQLTRKEKLKAAVKDYGAVVIVFHVSISLLSLGCCYMLVASGIDLSYILKEFGADEGAGAAGTAAHFVIAYAVHKTLAPARIFVTLTSVPFIVNKLRKTGILKTPLAKPQQKPT